MWLKYKGGCGHFWSLLIETRTSDCSFYHRGRTGPKKISLQPGQHFRLRRKQYTTIVGIKRSPATVVNTIAVGKGPHWGG